MTQKSQVSLIRCATYEPDEVAAALETALAPWGGMGRWTGPGKKVFLKVNLLLAAKPEQAMTTHPAVVEAVIRAAQATGAEVFFGDLPGGFHIGTTRKIHDKCGMTAVAERTGANLPLLEQYGFRERLIPGGKKITRIHTPKLLDDMDTLINLPKCKTHMQTKYTGAIKNFFGFLTTKDRMFAHNNASYPAFSSALVDIFSAFTPTLHIMDGVVGMEGTGPSQGTPVKLNMLLASPDAVALDAVTGAVLCFAPDEILTTRYAAARGLGAASLDRIIIHGGPLAKFRKKIKRAPVPLSTLLPIFGGMFNDLTSVKPFIKASGCRKCRHCVEVCPAGAIDTTADFHIDDERCIRCFCCHEMCEYGAVRLNKAPLVRIFEIINPR